MHKVLSSADQILTSGTSYWPERSPAAEPYPSLNEDVSCDVVVIGGGISGGLIAYRLASEGLKTILVDKARFGSGSTRASTALISYVFDLTLTDLIEQIGERQAIRAYELAYAAVRSFKVLVKELENPCDYEDKSAIRLTNNESDLKAFEAEAELRNRLNMPLELFDGEALAKRFGITAEYGLVSDNAAQIDPYKLTRRLVSRGISRGLRAHEDTRITQYDSGKKGIVLTTGDGAKISAGHVVFAAGYESEKYLGRKIKAKRNTDFCLISHPLKNMGHLGRCHFVENEEQYLYLSTFGDRVMIGIEGKAFYEPAERLRLIPRRTTEILERTAQYLPDIELKPEFSWASTFVNSPDSLPYIGTSGDFPGAIFALGYGGNGIASSAILAPIISDLVRTGKSPDAQLFSFDR